MSRSSSSQEGVRPWMPPPFNPYQQESTPGAATMRPPPPFTRPPAAQAYPQPSPQVPGFSGAQPTGAPLSRPPMGSPVTYGVQPPPTQPPVASSYPLPTGSTPQMVPRPPPSSMNPGIPMRPVPAPYSSSQAPPPPPTGYQPPPARFGSPQARPAAVPLQQPGFPQQQGQQVPQPGFSQQQVPSLQRPGFSQQQVAAQPGLSQQQVPSLQQSGFTQQQVPPLQPGFSQQQGPPMQQPGFSAPPLQQPGFSQQQAPPLQQPGLPGYPQQQVLPGGFSAGYPQQQSQGYYPSHGAVTQSFVEDFESLSISAAPGSIDVKMDALPRPADTPKVAHQQMTNCHPRYFEMTTNAIPNAHSLAARWHLPLGAIIHPLAEAPPGEEVPVVDFGPSGIVRCRKCRTYINPYAMFTDGGRYWRCSICSLLNDVPPEYVSTLDEQGRRRDAMERPELSCGSVDFVAPTEYMVRPPMPPVYFFLIDVSVFSVRSGMLQVAVDTIKSCLDKLPGFPRTQIGFLTFDSALHFYSLKSSLTQPQMVVMGQLDDPFLPLPDDLLVNLSESRGVVEALLDNLPSIFANNDNIESAFGPALRVTTQLMGELGGKLLIFQSTLPSLGVGSLKLRGEDARIYQTDREHTLRVAEDQFYKQMAAECSKVQIGVNVYAFSEKYTDIATLGTLAKYTGGQVYYYPGFQAAVDGQRLRYDLARDLTRETAWEAVMRIRCGRGVKFNIFHGHFMLRSSDLLALPAVDCDKAFSVQFALEDTLLTTQMVYFQVALLYTSSAGERRIRVHTAGVPVVQDLRDLYRAANVGPIMGVLSRLAVERSLSDKLENARQFVQVKAVNSLREFRNLHAVNHQLLGRMIFPESLKLLPLYVLALFKSLPLRGGFIDATSDERSAAGYEMMIMSLPRLMNFLYPSLIRLDEYLLQGNKPEGEGLDSPQQLPLTMEVLDPRGAFLFSDGQRFVLWLGNVLQSSDFVEAILGPQVAHSSDLRKVPILEQPNDLSKRFHSLLGKLRKKNPATYQPCLVVRQGESSRELHLIQSNLVEDRNALFPSYPEWMVQIHRQVQQKL